MAYKPKNYGDVLVGNPDDDTLERFEHKSLAKPHYIAPCCGRPKDPRVLNDMRHLPMFQIDGEDRPDFVCDACRHLWLKKNINLPSQAKGKSSDGRFKRKGKMMRYLEAPEADCVVMEARDDQGGNEP